MRIKQFAITLLVIGLVSPWIYGQAVAGTSKNIADAMRESGFTFKTARWTSLTTIEDGSGNPRTSTQKYWLSERKIRMEIQDDETMETQIIIDNGDQQYFYDPQAKTAMMMNQMMQDMYSGFLSSDAFQSAAEKRKAAKPSGKETINGKSCEIIEYQNTVGNITSNIKEWIWVEKQFPMKSIVTVPGQTVSMMGQKISIPGSKTQTEVTEVTLDQPMDPSLFELPKGVTIEAMGNPFEMRGEDTDEEE